jgi:RNA polymerase sigma factor (sigma-70 family)
VETPLEVLVERAKHGDKDALESLVSTIMDRVYGLAIRMLGHDEDAEDATQEILIRVITHLGTYRGDSAFTSWVYRVASNHLLNTRRRRAERYFVSLEAWEQQVEAGLASTSSYKSPQAEHELLVQEAMHGCIHAILVSLKRDLRLAYILGEVVGVTSAEGGYILDISPALFRKRLSRARTLLANFMRKNCGLVNEANQCRCEKQISYAVQTGCIDPGRLMYVPQGKNNQQATLTRMQLGEMAEIKRVTALFRSQPKYTAPVRLIESLKTTIHSRA